MSYFFITSDGGMMALVWGVAPSAGEFPKVYTDRSTVGLLVPA